LVTLLLVYLQSSTIQAEDQPIVTSHLKGDIVAIHGYDTVSYFTHNKAQKGMPKYQATYLNTKWWFTNKKNQQLFIDHPERYAPQFNGHCANGLSDGHQVPGNPKYFRIINDKLYFFYSKWGRIQWEINQKEQIQLANEYWHANN